MESGSRDKLDVLEIFFFGKTDIKNRIYEYKNSIANRGSAAK